MSGNWISVNDRIPKEDEKVLVCCCTKKGVKNINIAYCSNGFWHGTGSMSGVIARQPLPDLPEQTTD